jgi:hypothetical protein
LRCLIQLNRLAASLRMPADWLRKQADAGRIPCLVVGNCRWFNPDAVELALAELATQKVEVVSAK